jgi:hypothetical protein
VFVVELAKVDVELLHLHRRLECFCQRATQIPDYVAVGIPEREKIDGAHDSRFKPYFSIL